MSIDEVYDTDLWQELTKNKAFNSKYFEVMRRASYYVKNEDLRLNVIDNKLVVTYSTPILERELNCQCMSEMIYDFSIDGDGNLIVDEKFGTIRSNYGYDFLESRGGMVDTQYSCSKYDSDGIEIAFQSYNDSYALKQYELDMVKENFQEKLLGAYNPSLIYFNDYKDFFPKPGELGETPKYVRRTREKESLGLVDSIECEYNQDATLSNLRHELYFNTFLAHKVTFQPESICIVQGDPIANIDEKGNIYLDRRNSIRYGLTLDNYAQKANDKFLDELKTDRQHLSVEDIEARYDLMIGILEELKQKQRTN